LKNFQDKRVLALTRNYYKTLIDQVRDVRSLNPITALAADRQ